MLEASIAAKKRGLQKLNLASKTLKFSGANLLPPAVHRAAGPTQLKSDGSEIETMPASKKQACRQASVAVSGVILRPIQVEVTQGRTFLKGSRPELCVRG